MLMGWEVKAWQDVSEWLLTLDSESFDLVAAAIDMLRDYGPQLGRPLVDRVTASKHHNMKELRPGSTGRSEIRILFAFDPKRCAVLLVAGDKAGQWDKWYKTNIPIADARFDQWIDKDKES